MKGILLAFLVIVAVLFATVESRKGRRPGKGPKPGIGRPKKQGCIGRRCQSQECDDGFAKITLKLRRFGNKTKCVPCARAKQIQYKKEGMDVDYSKCPAVNTTEPPCPKRCAACDNGKCLECYKGFALVSKRGNSTYCIPCKRARKFVNSDKKQCPAVNTTEVPCPKKCALCDDGICQKCNKGFALVNSTSCVPCKKNRKFENSDKSQCQALCSKGCRNCDDGICTKCGVGFELNQETTQCEKKKGKPRGNKKPKRKGGKRRPKTTVPPKKP